MHPEEEEWLRVARVRRHQAFGLASASGDRGALLREYTRLHGGEALLAHGELRPGEPDASWHERFGLVVRPSPTGHQVKLDDYSMPLPPAIADELKMVLPLSPEVRRPSTPSVADAVLRRLVGYREYQSPTQKAAVRACLTMPPGSSLVVGMPTGGGKSLVFQVATLLWREGVREKERPVVLVIVPTIALALDHERSLRAIPGLQASRAITGSMSAGERDEILFAFARGEVPVLLLSPELALRTARPWLERAAGRDAHLVAADAPSARLAAIFVDEAHIIESWGRGFRPDFQLIPMLVSELRKLHPPLRTVLLSATVSEEALELLRDQYAHEGAWLEVSAKVPRYEFDIVAVRLTESERRDALPPLIDRAPRPAIIYTTEIEDAEVIFRTLKRRGYERLSLFTGDTPDDQRRRIVSAWSRGEIDLVVATSAFGMGVDKADVRSIIHAGLPEDPSRYYQELGRGARDGHQAVGVLLWTDQDVQTARALTARQWLSLDLSTLRWRAMLEDAEFAKAIRRGAGGVLECDLPLNARRQGLGEHTGARNRNWNQTLLNLLQRSGGILVKETREDPPSSPIWVVEIHDPRFLNRESTGVESLRQALSLREKERARATERLETFLTALRAPEDHCILTQTFELVEASAPFVRPCGRCPGCRAHGDEPPRSVTFHGTESDWLAPDSAAPLEPILHVLPDDPTFSQGAAIVIQRMLRAGVGQWLLPVGLAEVWLRELERLGEPLGLIEEHGAFLAHRWRLMHVPAAVILPSPGYHGMTTALGSDILDEVRKQHARWRGPRVFVLAASDMNYRGRSLSQCLGPFAPYAEGTIERLFTKGEA